MRTAICLESAALLTWEGGEADELDLAPWTTRDKMHGHLLDAPERRVGGARSWHAGGVARGGHRRSRQRNLDPRSLGGRIARET